MKPKNIEAKKYWSQKYWSLKNIEAKKYWSQNNIHQTSSRQFSELPGTAPALEHQLIRRVVPYTTAVEQSEALNRWRPCQTIKHWSQKNWSQKILKPKNIEARKHWSQNILKPKILKPKNIEAKKYWSQNNIHQTSEFEHFWLQFFMV